MIISIYADKAFDNIWNSFTIKILSKMRLEETYLNAIQAKCDKPTESIILAGKNYTYSP